jgi:hypothetical protein
MPVDHESDVLLSKLNLKLRKSIQGYKLVELEAMEICGVTEE